MPLRKTYSLYINDFNCVLNNKYTVDLVAIEQVDDSVFQDDEQIVVELRLAQSTAAFRREFICLELKPPSILKHFSRTFSTIAATHRLTITAKFFNTERSSYSSLGLKESQYHITMLVRLLSKCLSIVNVAT